MTRQIPIDKPLSDEDRGYLLMRGDTALIERLDFQYNPKAEEAEAAAAVDDEEDDEEDTEPGDEEDEDEEDEEGEDPNYEEWTIAELKAAIDKRNLEGAGLAVSGTKPDLAARLREHDAANE